MLQLSTTLTRHFQLLPRITFTHFTMPPKRKLATSSQSRTPAKKVQTTLTSAVSATRSSVKKEPVKGEPEAPISLPKEATSSADHYDALIVNRTYYPPVLSNARCEAYVSGDISNPLGRLTKALSDTSSFRSQVVRGRSVVCWFRTDLRWDDNTALATASTLAAGEVPVIGLFILSPQDLDAHLISPARIDFMLRSLQILKDGLEKKGIPLYCETLERRRRMPGRVLELAEEWGAKHVFANVEYEVDELRRDEKCVTLGVEKGIAVDVFHDTCVVPPDVLLTKVSFVS
jgi:deoxyribodipyrimidine photo-lyase